MRNLRLIHHLSSFDGRYQPPNACCWDVGSSSIICAYGPTETDTLVELKRWSEQGKGDHTKPQLIASWDAPCPLPELSCDEILNIQFFSETSTTCLVFAGGDVVLVRETPIQGEEKIEIVGSIDGGITAAAWSPDEEVLAICSKTDTVLFMTRDFDSSHITTISTEDLKASKHVSVGWGKSETQFKGKGAKALRDPTVPERVDQGLLSPCEDHSTTISWRGDGQYVAINSVQKSARRVIRVYTRDGILDGVTEPVDYLESALSWRPAGNLIAGIQRQLDTVQVVFFERNGLRHGQFPLRLTKVDQESWASNISLVWNLDSTVLAVGFRDRVQLWTMSNYQYYLKQEMQFSEHILSQPVRMYWHPERSLSLVAITQTGYTHLFEFISHISRADTTAIDGHGAVAVIDGASLKLTPMRYSNIPPPMALHEVDVGACLVDVAFYNNGAKHLLLVALTVKEIIVLNWNVTENAESPVISSRLDLNKIRPNEAEVPSWFAQQVLFSTKEKLYLLSTAVTGSTIHELKVEADFISISKEGVLGWTTELAGCSNLPSALLIILRDGTIQEHIEGLEPSEELEDVFPMPRVLTTMIADPEHCEAVGLPQQTLKRSASPQLIAVILTEKGQLYANDRRLASGCTSFLVTSTHILFTTPQNLLKFIHLTVVEDLEVPPDTPETDERCRAIERGAKLVTVIPAISALVLQMPRGNLETIYPRALVMAGIRRDIDHKQYLKAFKACRNHRVDMNIIHDYKPQQFLEDVPFFIQKLRKVEHIDLFLSQLRNGDVSVTIYRETSAKSLKDLQEAKNDALTNISASSEKVNRICDTFLKALRPLSATNLQNIITSHVCKTPPDLVSGLKEVSRLQKEDPQQAELAVEHICFLVDVNKLFDAALGLYDIKLALLVAQQAQKDPREYLPFLQKLSEQEPLRMKFEIDDHLGRYELCLEHLREIDDFEEFKAFVVKHDFYGEGLSMYKYHEEQIREIMRLYASYLTNKSRHQEAGVAYEYLQDHQAACESYRLAHSWREALTCANAAALTVDEVEALASGLADSLVELKDYHAAATIKLDYLGDFKSAAQLFCKGYHFGDATRILTLRGKMELMDGVVDTGLIEAMASTTEMLADCKSQLNAQVPRIRELRVKKEQDPLSFYDADVNGDTNIPDNVSLAGTDASTAGSTLFTRYTNRSGTVGTNASRKTSKNKRREERKRARGKKGSVYEEEYLVNSIGRLIDKLNSIGDEVNRLVVGLVRRRMLERARAVEAAMASVVGLCNDCIPEVFRTVVQPTEEPAGGVQRRQEGPNGATTDTEEEMGRSRPLPIVKPFEGLKLLSSKP